MDSVNKVTVRRNIVLVQVYRAVMATSLMVAIVVPFYQQNGLDLGQIFIVFTAAVGAGAVFDLPGGWFADCYGRKRSLLVGGAITAGGFFIEALSYDFWSLLIAGVIAGLGFAFAAGADSALISEAMKNVGWEDKYTRFEAFGMSIRLICTSLAAVGGSVLASSISLRMVMWTQVPITSLLIVIALGLSEPKRPQRGRFADQLKTLYQVVKLVLHDTRETRWLFLYFAILAAWWDTVFILRPIFCQLVGVPLVWFGPLTMAEFVLMAWAANTVKQYQKLGPNKVMWSFYACDLCDLRTGCGYPISMDASSVYCSGLC